VGYYSVNHSKFENNTSESGTFINFPHITANIDPEKTLSFNHNTFNNNRASNFGGVIYSGKNANRIVFSNCTFNNNQAKFGNIIYTHSKNSLPQMDIELNTTDIYTNPSYFKMDGNETNIENISIISGESIPKGIKCK